MKIIKKPTKLVFGRGWLKHPPRIATPLERVGRNDRCPCESEKKFKKCCGAAR
jgi:uncharacterized protein YecA (UPF0149 family)